MPSRKFKPVKPQPAGPWRWASGAVALVRAPLEWIGRNEQSVLIALLLIVLALWGFWTLAGEVSEGGTKRFDEWALRSLRHVDNPAKPLGPEWLAEVGRDMTALGGIAILTMLTLAVAGFLWLRRM